MALCAAHAYTRISMLRTFQELRRMAGHTFLSLLESGVRDAQEDGRALKQGNMDMGFLREVRVPCAPAQSV